MDTYLNEKQLARHLGLSHRTLQRWRQVGQGPHYLKLGGRIVYPLTDVEAWKREQRRSCTGTRPDARR